MRDLKIDNSYGFYTTISESQSGVSNRALITHIRARPHPGTLSWSQTLVNFANAGVGGCSFVTVPTAVYTRLHPRSGCTPILPLNELTLQTEK
mmetsp:Transcript_81244/g.131652  ORF Transcript_81244/g.131652 Transcript_81244/m.131652 type:complete len:93 (+) Transcript_81244:108-386(+)